MSASLQDQERTLLAAYREEENLYQQALLLAEALPDTAGLEQIEALLRKVAEVEARISVTRRQWQESHQQPGPELRAALGRIASLIERLMTQTHTAEQAATAERVRLQQEMDLAARGWQMRRAYGGQPSRDG